MPYLYLCLSIFCLTSSSVFGGFYNRRHEEDKGASALYNFLQLAFVCLLWGVLFASDFSFDYRVLPYSLLFGVFFTLCNLGLIQALRCGPVALTSLFMQLSLIAVTIWGFCFWGARVTPLAIVGLVLVAVSLWLCLYKGKGEGREEKFNGKWLFYALLAFVGNAGCSIVQRTQQTAFNGEYGNLLMFVATGISLLAFFIMFLRSDRTKAKQTLKRSWYVPAMAGGCNVALNIFIMLMAVSTLSPTVIYPTISVGGLIVGMLFSVFAFKEKLPWWQWVGVAIGAIAVGILSI